MTAINRRSLCAVVLSFCLPVIGSAPTGAHVKDAVVGGVEAIVGWQQEPPLAGEPNTVQVTLTKGGRPLPAEAVSLRVEVIFGGADGAQRLAPMAISPKRDSPGEFVADPFIPTRPGTYTFRLLGSIDGQNTDKAYTSGEAGDVGGTRFDDVREATAVSFPVADPSTRDLSAALERIEAAAASAAGSAASARTVAMAGVGVGVVALLLAALAAFRPRRAAG